MAIENFFSQNSRLIELERFELQISTMKSKLQDDAAKKLCDIIIAILKDMRASPKRYDLAQYNIDSVGDSFIDLIRHEVFSHSHLERALLICYRFFQEVNFSIQLKGGATFRSDGRNISFEIDEILPHFDSLRESINWARYLMPAYIMDEKLSKFPAIEKLALSVNELETREAELEAAYNKKFQQVNDLSKTLDDNKSKATFIKLNAAFEKLQVQKKKEFEWALAPLIAIGILLVLIPFILIFTHLSPPTCTPNSPCWRLVLSQAMQGSNIAFLFACTTMEVLLLYFFRVLLQQYRSIKAQLLQIDFRKSLCEVIQGYAEYAKDLKDTHEISLDKFETLIFSGIASNEEQIPSTFDGVEQISKIISSIKHP